MARNVIRAVSAAFLLAAALTSCDNFNLIGDFAQAANATGSAPLVVSPLSSTVMINETQSFSASGGSGSYLFSVGGSGGTIASNPGGNVGIYTAPSTAGSATVVLTDSADGRSVQATVTIEGSAPLQISPTSVTLTAGSSYQFSASGGSGGNVFNVANSDYPLVGESINSSGLYTAPSSASAAPRTVEVTDSSSATSYATVTVVSGGPLSISSPPFAQVTENSSFTFSASGGTPPYTFSASSGSITPTTGVYSASPTPVGTSVTVTVTDSLSATAWTTFDIIPAPPSNLTSSSSASGISLTWTDNASTANNDIVERQLVGVTGWAVVNTLASKPAGTANSWLDNTVQPNNKLYAYRVRVSSGSLYSNYSNTVIAVSTPH